MVTMAIISFTNYKRGQTRGGMGAVMRYTAQDWKTEHDGRQLLQASTASRKLSTVIS